MSIDNILAFMDQMPCDLLGVYPNETPNEFSAFFFGIRDESGVYGGYFATRPDLRSTGIGGKAFKAILEYYDDMPFWFSYESPFEESDNAEQRERRRKFYLKNGFYETMLRMTEFMKRITTGNAPARWKPAAKEQAFMFRVRTVYT